MNEGSPVPRVFISHSGLDKDRFVLDFARRLRANGIDAWLDRWEMLPGDSLMDKIFEEGIRNCTAFIVILSANSVNSKWVHEELNSGVVQRIERGSKLIPVRLDDCEVPQSLRHILYTNVPDTDSYDRELERIVNSVFGQYEKPPLGTSPAYATAAALTIGDLTPIDSAVFELACRSTLESGNHLLFTNTEKLAFDAEIRGISKMQVAESLEIMHRHHGYLKDLKIYNVATEYMFAFKITISGFQAFAEACLPDYGLTVNNVALHLVQGTHNDSDSIAAKCGQPVGLIRHIFDLLRMNNLIQARTMGSGIRAATGVSPQLRRSLEAIPEENWRRHAVG